MTQSHQAFQGLNEAIQFSWCRAEFFLCFLLEVSLAFCPSPVPLGEFLHLFESESSGSRFCILKTNLLLNGESSFVCYEQHRTELWWIQSLLSPCISLCSLLGLGELLLILLCFIQPCKHLTCVYLSCFNLLLFSFPCFAYCLCAVI